MLQFLQGAVAFGCAATGLYFFRFWRHSLDRLFLFFAAAFWIIAADHTAIAVLQVGSEWSVSVFVFRLLAYCLILVGIVDKNRR